MTQSNEAQRVKNFPKVTQIITSKEARSQSKHSGPQMWCLSFCFGLRGRVVFETGSAVAQPGHTLNAYAPGRL